MKYTVKPSTKFQKDVKRIQRRGYDISLLTEIIKKLANGETLPEKNKDHNLGGDYGRMQRMSYHSGLAVDLRNIW